MLDSYREHYGDTPVPDRVYSDWRASNIQVLTGSRTSTPVKIVVVDLDGTDAVGAWARICRKHGEIPPTWRVRTGSGGEHLWFRISGQDPCPSGLLWGLWDTESGWVKHREVRLLADNALIVAPPSKHIDTGVRYRFNSGYSPREIPLPAEAPAWLLSLPRLQPPRIERPPTMVAQPKVPRAHTGEWYDPEAVLAAINDKAALAKSWGLRLERSAPNQEGWISCRAIGREDRNPSASFAASNGVYIDMKDDTKFGFFRLGVELGRFANWKDCLDWCGTTYLGQNGSRR
jgi:hypothetical protein